jgi:hypothetical protein
MDHDAYRGAWHIRSNPLNILDRVDGGKYHRFNQLLKRWVVRPAGVRAHELVDVRYGIHVRFDLTPVAGPRDNFARRTKMFRARAKRQQLSHTPHLDCRNLVSSEVVSLS